VWLSSRSLSLVVLVSCLRASAAVAQVPAVASESELKPEPTPLARTLNGEARLAYDDAKLLLQNADPAGAVAKFGRAYTLSGDARLLWNIAVCEKALHHYASASDFVGRYLEQGSSVMTEEGRQAALAAQNALRALFSEVTLLGLPVGARVSVDGVPLAVAPLTGPLHIDLGQRLLRVELDGYEPLSQSLEVPGATALELTLTLTPKSRLATLAVLTSEPSALIALDGKAVGSRTWQGSVLAGVHRVRVTAREHRPYEISLELPAGSSRTLQVALQDARRPVWPWIVGAAAAVLATSVGAYLVLKPEASHVPAPQGELGNVQLPLSRSGH
jgi:hypothetical protein